MLPKPIYRDYQDRVENLKRSRNELDSDSDESIPRKKAKFIEDF